MINKLEQRIWHIWVEEMLDSETEIVLETEAEAVKGEVMDVTFWSQATKAVVGPPEVLLRMVTKLCFPAAERVFWASLLPDLYNSPHHLTYLSMPLPCHMKDLNTVCRECHLLNYLVRIHSQEYNYWVNMNNTFMFPDRILTYVFYEQFTFLPAKCVHLQSYPHWILAKIKYLLYVYCAFLWCHKLWSLLQWLSRGKYSSWGPRLALPGPFVGLA